MTQRFEIRGVAEGDYTVRCASFGINVPPQGNVRVHSGRLAEVSFKVPVNLNITTYAYEGAREKLEPCVRGVVGRPMLAKAEFNHQAKIQLFKWDSPIDATPLPLEGRDGIHALHQGHTPAERHGDGQGAWDGRRWGRVQTDGVGKVSDYRCPYPDDRRKGRRHVEPNGIVPTRDQALWVAIRDRTWAISFGSYRSFINRVLCHESDKVPENSSMLERQLEELSDHAHRVGAYQVLKTATEVFLLMECGVRIAPKRLFNQDEISRLGEPVTFDFIKGKLEKYLGMSAQLPYIPG